MPLKIDDLKTVESYKKAVKQEATKITTSGKTKFWIYKDVELPTAAGGKQKLPALIALVDDVATKAVLKGKQPWCRGTCELEGNKIAFAAAEGKVPYAVLIKSIPLLLGKMVHIPSGVDPESEGGEASPPPAPPAAGNASSPGRYAQLNAQWKQLAQQASQRITASPALRDSLTKAMAGIPEMLQGGKLAEAEKRIEQLQTALQTPPPGAPSPAQLNVQWKQLSQEASQKVAANPALRDSFAKAMAGIPEMLQGGKLGEARQRLEQLQAMLRAAPAAGGTQQGARPVGAPYPGIVKYRAALVQFAQAKGEVERQIRGLESAIATNLPHEAGFAKTLAAEIEALSAELGDAVDEAMKYAENEATPATDAIKQKIRKYLAELASNALVQKADSNPFGVSVTIGKTLSTALGRIRDAMPA